MKPRTEPRGRVYILRPKKAAAVGPKTRRKVILPRPKAGDRRPRAYSSEELDALYATAHSVDWKCLVSLKTPPEDRIVTHERLTEILAKLKRWLENNRKRHGYPAAIVVTEFDPHTQDEEVIDTAHFHIGFAAELNDQQQAKLRSWWLKLMGLPNNQGRAFDYRAKGGGKNLQAYLAKDLIRRGGIERRVKYPVAWLPCRIDCRLWFVVGMKRASSRSGRDLRASTGKKRKRFERERVRAHIGSVEGEHGLLPITTDAQAKSGEGFKPEGKNFLTAVGSRIVPEQPMRRGRNSTRPQFTQATLWSGLQIPANPRPQRLHFQPLLN